MTESANILPKRSTSVPGFDEITHGGLPRTGAGKYGSEVLMGTARMQKESEEAAARRCGEHERARRHRDLERRLQQARRRVEDSQDEVELLMAELESEAQADLAAEREAKQHAEDVLRRRAGARRHGREPVARNRPAAGAGPGHRPRPVRHPGPAANGRSRPRRGPLRGSVRS